MKINSTPRRLWVVGMCLFGLFTAQVSAQNLLTNNAGFEDGTKGWENIDGSYWRLSKSAAPWRDGGEHSLQRVAFKGSKKGDTWTRYNAQKIPVSAGAEYVLRAALAGGGGGTGSWSIFPVLQVQDAQGRELAVLEGEKLVRKDAAGGYVRLPATLKMPEGAAAAKVGVRVVIDENLSDVAYLHFDTLSLSKAEAQVATVAE